MSTPTFQKTLAPRHGEIRSEDWNTMQSQLEYDLVYLFDQLSSVKQDLEQSKTDMTLADLRNRAAVDRIIRKEEEDRRMQARRSEAVHHTRDFRSSRNLYFEHTDEVTWSIAADNRLRLDIGYGQLTLPYDRVVSRFYSADPDTRSVVPVQTIDTTITAVSESNAIKVINGDISKAFDGHNNNAWKREVWYPLHSDVEEVIVDVDITIPVSLISKSNVIQVHPYPDGLVDIMQVYYETSDSTPVNDLTDAGTTSWVGDSVPALESSWFRGHFKPLGIQRLKLRLRQRNFVERNGFKVFTYGLQDVGLLLVDFDNDDTNLTASSPHQDKAVVVRFDAPEGYDFDKITGIWTDPVVSDDLVLAVYSDFALSNRLWTSTSSLPQDGSDITVPASTSSVYVSVGMGYDQANDVAPILKDMSLRYTTVAQ